MSIAGRNARRFKRMRAMNTLLLGVFFIYAMIPIFYLFVASTKSSFDLYSTFGLWFAPHFNLMENLRDLFSYDGGIYLRWFLNTLFYASTSAIGATLLACMAGYAFSRYTFRGQQFMFATVLGAVMIPQTVLVIPIFLMLAQVGLVDSMWGVILPSLVYAPGVYLMRAYIDQSVPMELLEAARLDGASEAQIFARIAFRLMAPSLLTVFLLSFVHCWNLYFLPLVMLNSSDKLPITVGLSTWYAQANTGSGGKALFSIILAGALISVIPIIVAFLGLQRFWEGGLTSGAVK